MCQRGEESLLPREGTLPCLEMHFIIRSWGRGATGNYRAQARDAARPQMTHGPILMAKMHPISYFKHAKVESVDSRGDKEVNNAFVSRHPLPQMKLFLH